MDWWTDSPNLVVGCQRCGSECDNCFAIDFALRKLHPAYEGLAVMTDDGPDWTGEVRWFPERVEKLDERLKNAKSRQYVVVTLHGDLFFRVPDDFVVSVLEVAAQHPEHVIMSLTKRPEAQRRFCAEHEPPTNLWLGTSVGTQQSANRKISILAETKVAQRFISFEPLIEPVDVTGLLAPGTWVIIGGESGRKNKITEMHAVWARSIIKQARIVGCPVWFKQWGDLRWGVHVGRKVAGNVIDGRRWLQRPDGTDLSFEVPE